MRFDALIVGGSFAGLSAAMYIARARRTVCVIDVGLPRNRFAGRSHGFFSRDGSEPGALLATARAQVAAYPTVTMIYGRATQAAGAAGEFGLTLATGEALQGARLVLAFGVSDELPSIPGLAERWGHSVLHCPYCHGFEFSERRLGVLSVAPSSVHQAMLVSEWGPTTLYLNGTPEPEPAALAELRRRGVAIEPAAVLALRGAEPEVSAIELADGRLSAVDALYVGPRTRLNSDLPEQLGCALQDGRFGSVFVQTTDERLTSVPGVYAAGDIARDAHNATWASADGVTAGTALHRSLVF
jgi:thioredoxin reductase